MKRFLLSAFAAVFAMSGFAQSLKVSASPEMASKSALTTKRLPINQNPTFIQTGEGFSGVRQISATEVEVGDTRYDLQTNSAIQRRLINHGNGTVSASWTFSSVNSWATRGTGYNYFNGSSWGTAPTSEIESERTGWPSLLTISSGKEIVISHSTANNVLRKSDRSSVGSGTWTQANLTSLDAQVWNRATSDPSTNSIHMIGMTLPTALAGSVYNGMDGALLYFRSSNGGTSWDISNFQIPGTDSAYHDGLGGDAYAIDVKGDTVAIVVGEIGRGVQLFKSTNNGQSWTKTDALTSDIWFVENETFIDSTNRLFTSDGNVAVLLDANGDAHVWFARMFIENDDLNDGSFTYFPLTNGISYWNESYPEGEPIYLTGALDYNGNGTLDFIGTGIETVGRYGNGGLCGHPQAGIDDEGCIYLSYMAYREDLDNGSQNYRHTYVMRSCDGGCTWSFPIDVTGASANNFSECVYPTIARNVDTLVHVLYMSDNEPGIAVSGDEDPAGVNKMIYLTESTDRFDTTDLCPVEIVGNSQLCVGGTGDLEVIGCASAYSWSGPGGFSATTASVNITAVGTYTCTVTTSCGSSTEEFEVTEYTGTSGPPVSVQASVATMCAGDTSVITASSTVSGVTFLWSANAGSATTPSVTVTAPGLYTVTVTDCGSGTTVESFEIFEPNYPPNATIVGDLFICPGESTTLTALQVTGGNYTWSTGGTSPSVTVSAAGTYTVTVDNCGGTSTASVTVSTEPAPAAAIDAPETEVCEGGQLTATASGGSGYEWSNGSTSATLTISEPSESGTYTVTVTNDCGDEDTETVTLTIHPQPAAPSVTFNGTEYVSSQTGAGTHRWFVNGTEITSFAGNTLPNNQNYFNLEITCIYVDENGCESPESSAILSTEELASNGGVTVYPNPNNGRFEVRFGDLSGKVHVEVTDVLGKVVYSNNVTANSGNIEVIDLNGVESGVYQLNLRGDAINMTQSVIVE